MRDDTCLTIPCHIAIIMDGNGRWAQNHGFPKRIGHRQGMCAAERVVKSCKKLGVKYLTLYAFSSENWQRPEVEIDDLMVLLSEYLRTKIVNLIENDIRVIFIGERYKLPASIQELMCEVEQKSKLHIFTLIVAISYGARDEIRAAALAMARDIVKHYSSEVGIDTNHLFDHYINPHNIPDPDLLIRTSGEYRVSNFLLWQLAYTELYFTNILWPDFTEDDLLEAIKDFGARERRYGRRNDTAKIGKNPDY